MSLLGSLACLPLGGHRWETTTDIAGSITRCARCGKTSHGGASVSEAPADSQSAGNPHYHSKP
jgi:hypothetical protein